MTACSSVTPERQPGSRRFPLLALLAGLLVAGNGAAEIVVVVHTTNPTGPLGVDQVAHLFMGQTRILTPVEQAKNSAIRREFYQKVAGKTLNQVESNWARLEFTGRGTAPHTYPTDAEVKKAIARDRNAIGYIDKGSVDKSLKVVLSLP